MTLYCVYCITRSSTP